MICPATAGYYQEHHIFMRAVELPIGQAALFEYFFKDPKGFPIDPNVLVEVLKTGESSETASFRTRRTLLDVVNASLSDETDSRLYSRAQLNRLKKILMRRYSAITAAEMREPELETRTKRYNRLFRGSDCYVSPDRSRACPPR